MHASCAGPCAGVAHHIEAGGRSGRSCSLAVHRTGCCGCRPPIARALQACERHCSPLKTWATPPVPRRRSLACCSSTQQPNAASSKPCAMSPCPSGAATSWTCCLRKKWAGAGTCVASATPASCTQRTCRADGDCCLACAMRAAGAVPPTGFGVYRSVLVARFSIASAAPAYFASETVWVEESYRQACRCRRMRREHLLRSHQPGAAGARACAGIGVPASRLPCGISWCAK